MSRKCANVNNNNETVTAVFARDKMKVDSLGWVLEFLNDTVQVVPASRQDGVGRTV